MSNDKSRAQMLADELENNLRGECNQAAAELRRLDAVNRELLEALREIEAEAGVFGGGFGSWISMRARAAIAKATDV